MALMLGLLFLQTKIFAQYPGGVSTGTTRGYKVDYYNGSWSDVSLFGVSSANTSPGNTGYSSIATNSIFYDNTYYGLEFSGTLEIATAGNYTFAANTVSAQFVLMIDNVLYMNVNTGGTSYQNGTATVNLSAGDHTIKIKYRHYNGQPSTSFTFRFTAVPAGSGITVPTNVDGRFVRSENAKLNAWYKASNLSVTSNYSGVAGNDKVNSWTNMAPGFSGNGNFIYGGVTSSSSSISNASSLINFNPAVNLSGDDMFYALYPIKGLSYYGATRNMFMINNYVGNVGQTNTWLFNQGTYATGTNNFAGFWKDGNNNTMGFNGGGGSITSAYTAGEPKLLTGSSGQLTGGAAPANSNPFTLSINGSAGNTQSGLCNVYAENIALKLGTTSSYINNANIPEMIYYPFQLSAVQEQKVNTYLGIKYGVTLQQDYINTSGATVFGLTANAGYTNRIFGIGRELSAEALNQKQSQSQMKGAANGGHDFLVLSKGAVAANNAANTGTLADGDYMIFGDNGNATIAAQTTELPAAFVSGTSCTVNRLNREWKAQVTGNPGAVTIQAGSTGSFLFSGTVAGLVLLVDTDNDGNFTTGTVTTYPVSSISATGVATFNNIPIANGNVFTFGWSVTAPGGVSTGLKLWSKADDANLATGTLTQWNDLSTNLNHLSKVGGTTFSKVDNMYNYNPSVLVGGQADDSYLQSGASLGMNGSNTYAEFYLLRGVFTSGIAFDEIITLGGGNHRWENSAVGLNNGSYGVYGTGTTASAAATPVMGNLGLYSNNATGTQALLRINGAVKTTTATTSPLSLSGNFRIGTDVAASDGNYNGFYVPELIVYNTNVPVTDIRKINSYLGIKYSIPMDDGSGTSSSQYVASNGQIIWPGDATYKFGMFGIGRDDCSGLMQKQSKAYIDGTDIVAFGLNKLATTNQLNTNSFTADKQFIVIGNDGGAFTGINTNIAASYTSTSCNAYRYVRSWKVKNTGSVTNALQMTIGNTTTALNSNWNNITLAINSAGDNTFATGTTTLVPATSITGGVATFDNVVLPDDAVFTLFYTLGAPGGVMKPADGIAFTTVGGVSSSNNINGLSYKVYSTDGAITRNLISSPLGTGTDALLGTGYYPNATNFHSFITSYKRASNLGIELTGKLYIPAPGSSTYQFRVTAPDDQLAVIIDGVLQPINVTTYTASNVTSANVNLSTGYHDIIIRGAAGAGVNFNLQWNGGSGASFVAIPDANFFTTVQGPSGWFATDNNLLTSQADGTNMNGVVWPDLSSWQNDITGTGNPTYYSTTTSTSGLAGIRNYNPGIYFTADAFYKTGYLNGFAYGHTGKTVLTVATGNTTSGTNTAQFGYGTDGVSGGSFAMNKITNGALQVFLNTTNVTESSPFYSAGNANTTNLVSGYVATDNTYGIHVNGAIRTTLPANITGYSTLLNNNEELMVGGAPDYSVNYDGNINEVVYYPWTLNATERQKVNSYLAIKWGITLDQTTATDYLASNGTTMWNSTTAAGTYKNAITGIGRDDCGALYQKQSHSYDDNDIVAMAKGSIAANNYQNTGAFSTDKTFLLWANNGLSVKTFNTTNMPASLSSSACYVKVDRVWQSQTVGAPGPVSVAMGLNGVLSINRSNYKPILLVSSSPTDFSAATLVYNDSVIGGKAWFSNVDFGTNTTKYFTLAYINAAPGGVTSGLTVWFDASADAFKDIAQTTYAVTDGDQVASLNNVAFGASLLKVEQPTASRQPVYYAGKFNYNPSLYFDGATTNPDNLYSAIVPSSAFRSTNSLTAVLGGANYGTSGANQFIFWGHGAGVNTSNGNAKTTMELNQCYFGSPTSMARTPGVTVPELYSFAYTSGVNYTLYKNLLNVGSNTKTGNATATDNFYLGGYNTGAIASSYNANFDMGEFVIYNDDKRTAAAGTMERIHSYMATKYGYTLDRTAIGGAYIASDGTATYNHAAYWNRITGIGMDDCSALEQKQSFSQETGALVKISNDATNGLAATNAANTSSFAANKSFLLFGDNNKALTWTGVDKVPGNLVHLNRIWRVKETGTISTVYLQVPASTNAATYKLPGADNATVYLLVSHTNNFASPDAIIEMTPDASDNLSVTYDFADGDYYTFAAAKSCIAPAGISDGLTTWYRTDNKTTGAATNLADETANINLVKFGSGAANIIAGIADNNFNRYLQLTAGTGTGSSFASSSTDQSETALTSATAGTLYGVTYGTAKDRLFSVSRSAYNTLGMTLTGTNPVLNNAAVGTAYGAGVSNVANIWGMKWDGTNATAYTNGVAGSSAAYSTALTANATHYVGIGGSYAGGTYTRSGIAFNEAFSYNRALSTTEQQNLNSYLALKYGQTLTHNYFSPAYDGTNAATTTIYDISTYGNRVFGVGMDSAGCFSQNQSKSVVAGNMITLSADATIAAENSRDMSRFTVDRTYVAGGDDNGLVTTWNSAFDVPALYTASTSCVVPARIEREWKFKALNNDQTVLVSIPASTSAAATKLPAMPVGATKVYMIVNENANFTTNASQEEILMTLNGTEWQVNYSFPKDVYKYITFATKPDATALTPIAIANGTSDATNNSCDSLPYTYYRGTSITANAIIAINPNGNTWSPSNMYVNNTGTHATGSTTFVASGAKGYYQSTDGVNTIRVSRRMHTIIAPGTYNVNGGIVVRLYYEAADLTNIVSDAMPGGFPVADQGWFKAETSSAAATVANMVPGNLITGKRIIPINSGTENGVSYVEFLVNSFSTFGYYAKTTATVLPVTLTSFTSAIQDCKTQLKWKTAEESGFDRFEIERSNNGGTNYSTIGTVNAAGTNTNYNYADNNPVTGKNLYRLKMIDADGKYKYSSINIVMVNCNGQSSVIVYPNPASEVIKVSISGYANKVTGKLYNSLGQLERTAMLVNGTNDIQTGALSNGLYSLLITDETGKTSTYKIMVKH